MPPELVKYRVGEVEFDAYVARPDGAGACPAVLVFHAFGGRDDFAEGKARALAELGYVGVGADLYGVGRRGTDRASSGALMNALIRDAGELRRRIAAAVDAARALPGVAPDRLGAIGFCFGGLAALLAARMGLPLRGVVSFHALLKVGEPLDARPAARILVQHGQDDPMVPDEDVARFAAEMRRVRAEWQLHAYPGVVHAFTNPAAADAAYGTVYDADADRRSWAEMRRFFEEVFE